MNKLPTLTVKDAGLLRKKLWLRLIFDLLIVIFGVTSLYEKFFVIDGVIAFRAFTIDGNLFTTIVSFVSLIMSVIALKKGEEASTKLYMFELCAAVTEAIIFIIVMIGYLPFIPDTPKITPYHMFCLHVAIPILSVARFILLERPIGTLGPLKLLSGAIPIGVYGLFVVIAIKSGVLPSAFVPYSFLDFSHNYIWYFMFALFFIPGFGYIWSFWFYRLNHSAASIWYKQEDLEAMEIARLKAMPRFDIVNSSISIVFCLLSILLLSCSMMTTSKTSSKVQGELVGAIVYLMLDSTDRAMGDGEWAIRDGKLYKGDDVVGDMNNPDKFREDDAAVYNTAFYIQASMLPEEYRNNYSPNDYVAVKCYTYDGTGPQPKLGEVLDKEIVDTVFTSEDECWYKTIKYDRELTEEELKYKEQLRNTKDGYYRFCMSFGKTMTDFDSDVGIVEMYVPSEGLLEQIKDAEYSSDIIMAAVIACIFGILFIITFRWIKTLEKTTDFLKQMAQDEIPDRPIDLGKNIRNAVMAHELNTIREAKLKKMIK